MSDLPTPRLVWTRRVWKPADVEKLRLDREQSFYREYMGEFTVTDDYPHDPENARPRSVCVVCPDAMTANLMRHVFGDPRYWRVAAGGALIGCMFNKIIYLPGWDRVNHLAWEWRTQALIGRRTTKYAEEVFL